MWVAQIQESTCSHVGIEAFKIGIFLLIISISTQESLYIERGETFRNCVSESGVDFHFFGDSKGKSPCGLAKAVTIRVTSDHFTSDTLSS